MTALRLGANGTESPPYAVVGACTMDDAVYHVGLLEGALSIADGDTLSVFHMADPRTRLQLPGTLPAHAVGWFLDLPGEECERIRKWVGRFTSSAIEIMYVAFPSYQDLKDPATGRTIGRRFSCAGLVQACYEEALKVLLVVPTDDLPEVKRDVLELVWSRAVVARGWRYGLEGPGPWKVLLPSYLFHALSKDRAELPHKPPDPDPYFRP